MTDKEPKLKFDARQYALGQAFMTGSYAYGTVHEKSDIDIVVSGDSKVFTSLQHGADKLGSDVPESECLSLTFGQLNFLVCTSQRAYDIWVKGTKQLIAEAPVTRDRAIEVFSKLRADNE